MLPCSDIGALSALTRSSTSSGGGSDANAHGDSRGNLSVVVVTVVMAAAIGGAVVLLA
jgi:hypothetical protein